MQQETLRWKRGLLGECYASPGSSGAWDAAFSRLRTARTDIPGRTDIEEPIPYRQNKHALFGQQEGLFNGCLGDFPFKLFEVDYRVPRSRGGSDHIENLQLLCSSYNRIKRNRGQEYLVARLVEIGV